MRYEGVFRKLWHVSACRSARTSGATANESIRPTFEGSTRCAGLRRRLAGAFAAVLVTGCAGNDFMKVVDESDHVPLWSAVTAQGPYENVEDMYEALSAQRGRWAERRIEGLLDARFPPGSPVEDLVAYLESQDFGCDRDAKQTDRTVCRYLVSDPGPFSLKFPEMRDLYRYVRWEVDIDAEKHLIRTANAAVDIGEYRKD